MRLPQFDEPLGLAVHSLPSAGEVAASPPSLTGRWKLLAIVLLCSLPMIAAYLAYFVVRPQGQAGLGDLVEPIRPVGELSAATLDGVAQPLAALKGQWLLVSVGAGDCQADCQQRLFLQRQLRETLGKDKDRVDRVWLVGDNAPISAEVRASVQDATVLRVTPEVLQAWMPAAADKVASDYLFVVDPLGNTMLRFPSHFDGVQARKARRDLDRLLRASLAWDPPGR
ncbi:MAG: hypothetical protein WCK83_06035 [Burkholderiales bacterium]